MECQTFQKTVAPSFVCTSLCTLGVFTVKFDTWCVIFRIVLSLFATLSFTATIYHWWFVETSTDDESKTQQQQEQEMAERVKKGDADVTNDDSQSRESDGSGASTSVRKNLASLTSSYYILTWHLREKM